MVRSFLALLLFPSVAFATIFLQRPLQQEVQETPTIVRGSIGASYSDWGSDGSSKRIYTYYRLQVSETLKGDAESGMITIRELGGEKDGIGMQIAGAAHFSQGEDVVVFLGDKNSDGSFDVHGLSSGKFNLSRGPDGAECLTGIALAEPEADGFVHPDDSDHSSGHCSWTLAGLRQVIRDQGDAPKENAPKDVMSSAPRVLASPSPSKSLAPSPRIQNPQAAPQLQPPASEKLGLAGGGRLWIIVFAVGLAGLIVLLLK